MDPAKPPSTTAEPPHRADGSSHCDGRAVDLDDNQRATLARLEADLSGVGSRMRRRLARRSRPRRGHTAQRPLWGAAPDNGAPPADLDVRRAIVVGCDGRPESDAAVRFAFAEAQLRSAPVIVVTTFYRPVDPDVDEFDTPEAELRGSARSATDQSLCRALSLPDHRLPPHRLVVGSGNPWRLLLQHYGDAQLIVVGKGPRGLVRKLVHGASVGSMLIRRANVPIVVVPATPA
jgi:nucleotide-binding universal stress UspA family protein